MDFWEQKHPSVQCVIFSFFPKFLTFVASPPLLLVFSLPPYVACVYAWTSRVYAYKIPFSGIFATCLLVVLYSWRNQWKLRDVGQRQHVPGFYCFGCHGIVDAKCFWESGVRQGEEVPTFSVWSLSCLLDTQGGGGFFPGFYSKHSRRPLSITVGTQPGIM